MGQLIYIMQYQKKCIPDSKVHGANMGPTWVLSATDGPHAGPMNLALWYMINFSLDFHAHMMEAAYSLVNSGNCQRPIELFHEGTSLRMMEDTQGPILLTEFDFNPKMDN